MSGARRLLLEIPREGEKEAMGDSLGRGGYELISNNGLSEAYRLIVQ